jgi:hypothetical protein
VLPIEAIQQILAAHGYEDVATVPIETHIKIELDGDGMMPLVIEKIGENRISVAHYYVQYGDLMSDPEIVFHIEGNEWIPVRYTEHPHIHDHNENGLYDVAKFAKQWSENLEKQGYVEAGRKAASVSSSSSCPEVRA